MRWFLKGRIATYLATAIVLLLFMGFPYMNVVEHGAQQLQSPLVPVSPNLDRSEVERIINSVIYLLRTSHLPKATSAVSDKLEGENLTKETRPAMGVPKQENFNVQELSIEIESVHNRGLTAEVICHITDGKQRINNARIILSRTRRGWLIEDAPELSKIVPREAFNRALALLSNTQFEGPSSPTSVTNVRISNTLLIPFTRVVPSVVNANYTTSRPDINRRLFGTNATLDIEWLLTGPGEGVAFVLDPYWDRIVYSYSAGSWIRAYSTRNEYIGPRAMAADVRGNLYVTDTENGRIVKLQYNNGTISQVSAHVIPGVVHPIDITVALKGEPGNPSNNRIWVVDDFSGLLVELNTDMTVLRTAKYYHDWQNRQTYRLRRPRSVHAQIRALGNNDNDYALTFIDGERNAFVFCYGWRGPTFINDSTIWAFRSIPILQPGSYLASIGEDYAGCLYVADKGLGMVHNFGLYGWYLASYGGFVSPRKITNAPWRFGGETRRLAWIFTSDPWSNTTGIRGFYSGADAVDLEAGLNLTGDTYAFSCLVTGWCRINTKIVRASDNSIFLTLRSNSSVDFLVQDWVARSSLPPGSYKYRVEVKPYHNSFDFADSMQWVVRELPFHTFAPLSASITGPTCRYNGQSGIWTANVGGGSGNRTYQWYVSSDGGATWTTLGTGQSQTHTMFTQNFQLKCRVRDNTTNENVYTTINVAFLAAPAPQIIGFVQFPDSIRRCGYGTVRVNATPPHGLTYGWAPRFDPTKVRVTIDGRSVKIQHLCGGLSPKLDPQQPCNVPTVELTSIVSDCAERRAIGTWLVRFKCDTLSGGCPFVYTWNGESYVEDNNILPQSEDPGTQGQDVTDFYHLYKRPVITEDRYKLIIGEFERERSHLDHVRLMLIDHRQDMFVTVDDSGTVVQFAKPAAFLAAELDSTKVLEQLSKLDNVKVETAENDTMRLWFTNDGSTYQQGLLLVAEIFPGNEKRPFAGVVQTKGEMNSTTFSAFRLRRNPCYAWVLVPAADTGTIQIEIEWKQSSSVDYSELSKQQQQPFTVQTADLLHAEHSTYGDVTEQLRTWDQGYTDIQPVEWIELEFSAPPLAQGMERSFVLVSRGRYERMQQAPSMAKGAAPTAQTSSPTKPRLPTTYDISQNFPNPFNPTTIIKYRLPEDGHVSLKVYDIVGRVVATLVDERQSAGYYEVRVDATSLASGVYLYRMTASNYVATRKFVVVK